MTLLESEQNVPGSNDNQIELVHWKEAIGPPAPAAILSAPHLQLCSIDKIESLLMLIDQLCSQQHLRAIQLQLVALPAAVQIHT